MGTLKLLFGSECRSLDLDFWTTGIRRQSLQIGQADLRFDCQALWDAKMLNEFRVMRIIVNSKNWEVQEESAVGAAAILQKNEII